MQDSPREEPPQTPKPEKTGPGSDPQEARMIELFCRGQALRRCLASFCKDTHSLLKDPVLHVLLTAMNTPVQIQLTGVGLQLFQAPPSIFKGTDLTFPYFRMDQVQREFLLDLTSEHSKWAVHESSMLWRHRGARVKLPALDILEAMCAQILSAEKAYADPRARVAICNIVLQRVQASVPLTPALQAELNARLFPQAVDMQDEPACEAQDEPACEAQDEPVCEAQDEPACEAQDEPACEAQDEPAGHAGHARKDTDQAQPHAI